MTVLYKIIQATDERFKSSPNVEEEISNKCCNLKNILLEYSNDTNQYENNIERLGQIARSIHQFSSKYRRKPKKTRRPSHGTDVLKLPKFEHKIKSASDCEEQDSDFSMVISHDCDDENQDSYQIGQLPKKQLQPIKQVMDDLKDSTNSRIQMQVPTKSKPALIKPPSIINTLNKNPGRVEQTEKVEQFLRNQGVLQNSLQFSGNFKNFGLRSLKESHNMDEESGHNHNFLSESIEKMRIDDMSFEVEIDEQNKLFISN